MKKKDVTIGGVYMVRVSGLLSPVKVEATCLYGGWTGRNLATGREVRIRTAAKLRQPLNEEQVGRLQTLRTKYRGDVR